jgi:alpha-L-rhamnosidase
MKAILLPLLSLSLPGRAYSAVQPVDLRCEYLINPLGIDATRPRLSWILHSHDRGQRQTAYRVLVAGSPDRLRLDKGDLWDTGKVVSDQSIQVEYAGKPLASHMRCWWKVRVWGMDGRPSRWSAPATWSMGILTPQEWQAKWIGYTRPGQSAGKTAEPVNFDGCQWVWFPEGDPQKQVSAGKRYFRRTFELPAGAKVEWARVLMTVDDQFVLFVNGKQAGRSGDEPDDWRHARMIDAAGLLRPGKNLLAIEATNVGASPAAAICKLVARLDDGKRVTVVSDAKWRCSDREVKGWKTPLFDDAAWQEARQIGGPGTNPWGNIRVPADSTWGQEAPSPILRKAFKAGKPARHATATICGLGYYELRLNGAKVGDHELDPGYTRYDKRCLYVTYDVTDRIRRGDNVVGVMLGNGWYNQHAREEWNFHKASWRDRPKLLFSLKIIYADGTTETIVSDESWRASTGPVVLDGIRNGEVYDARLEQDGWDRPDFNDAGWQVPQVFAAPRGQLQAQMMPPIRVTQTIRPVKITEPKPGVFIYDLGQNIAGRALLKVSGPAGAAVTLRYSERLDKDGLLQRSQIDCFVYQGPFQTETYILKGKGLETWESRFTYHGFQYVEVTGFPGKPTLDNLQGRVLHTDFPFTGEFECSNPLLNAIQRLTRWSYRSNFESIPTDCPQREKNGWTGDAQLAAEQAMYNFENTAAYAKWMNDFDDVQKDAGDFPGIVPTYDWGYGTGPAWDSAFIIIPWYLYEYRGDTRVISQHYDRMKRYVDYLTSRAKNGIVDYGLGDWVPARTETPAGVTSTGYYYVDALTLSRFARILGKTADAERYAALAGQVRKAFVTTFCKGDGLVANGSQTALSCAVYQGLADPKDRARIVEQLVANVEREKGHLDTGILGAKYLFHSLSDNGRHDVAYRIATQTTPPSYGDWLKRGATTLWEDWKGEASLNHIMFGDISAWFYQELAGIHATPYRPAFKHIVLRPRPVGDLTFVRASTRSPYGTISSDWKIEGGTFRWKVTVPPNTTATIYVPSAAADRVMDGSTPATQARGLHFVRYDGRSAIFLAAAGTYQFCAPLAPARR